MGDKTETKEDRKRGYEGTRRYEYDVQNTYKGMTKDEWRAMIVEEYEAVANKATCEWLLFCFHDKDVDEQGLPKPLHVHFVVKFKAGRTTKAVMDDFCGTNPRTDNCKWVDARKGGYKSLARYMTHHSESAYNARKTWYHHSDVYAYGIEYLELIKSAESKKVNSKDMKDSAEELTGAIMSGKTTKTIAVIEFEEKHGSLAAVEYMPKFESAERIFADKKQKELEQKSVNGTWSRTTTYVSGEGRSGKSRTAVYMASLCADEFGVHVVAGGGGRNVTSDLVDGYGNQKSAVINDIESSEFKYRDFYNMFDPDNWSITKSRNHNKPWFVEQVYITNNTRLEKFLFEMLFYSMKTFRSRDGKLKDLSDDEIKSRGLMRLNGREDTLEGCRMVARRVKYYMNYSKLEDGTPVVELMQLVDDLPSHEDIRFYVLNHCEGIYDERLFGLFFNKIGYVPYDKIFVNKPQFEAERKRIAEVTNEFFETGKFVKGLVMLKEKSLLSEVQNEIEKDKRRNEMRQQKERQRIAELEEKAKKYDELKSVKTEQLKLEIQENELLQKIMDKMPRGSLSNPFEASAFLDELKESIKPIVAQGKCETASADPADVIN